jgi:hypothetical protein
MVRHRGQHDDWHSGRCAQPAAEAKAVLVLQHDVENHEIDRVLLEDCEHCGTIRGGGNGMSVLPEEICQ